jgi:uncharacterized membrane protein
MKMLPNILAVIGLLLLLVTLVGKFAGNPNTVMHYKLTSIVLLANTAFLLAILAKLSEKK